MKFNYFSIISVVAVSVLSAQASTENSIEKRTGAIIQDMFSGKEDVVYQQFDAASKKQLSFNQYKSVIFQVKNDFGNLKQVGKTSYTTKREIFKKYYVTITFAEFQKSTIQITVSYLDSANGPIAGFWIAPIPQKKGNNPV